MKSFKKAFTLIELLVVIAIIAILAAILFPVFTQAKLAAKGTQSLSNIKQVGTANMIYLGSFDDTFVCQYVNETTDWGWQNTWIMNVMPYFKSYGIVLDPTDKVPLISSYNSGPKFSYVANGILLGSPTGASPFWRFHGVINTNGSGGATNWYEQNARTQTAITHDAETVLFATRSAALKGGDKDPYASGGSKMEGAFSPWNSVLNNIGGVDNVGNKGTLPGWANNWGMPDATYKGGLDRTFSGNMPVVYCDSHAKSVAPEKTMNFNGDIKWGQVAFESDGNPFAGQWDATRP